jgi:hypothetical protein
MLREREKEWRVIAENDEPSTAVGKGHRALCLFLNKRSNAMMYLGSNPRNTVVLGGVMPYGRTILYLTCSPGCHARNDLSRNEYSPHLHHRECQILAVIVLGHPSCTGTVPVVPAYERLTVRETGKGAYSYWPPEAEFNSTQYKYRESRPM